MSVRVSPHLNLRFGWEKKMEIRGSNGGFSIHIPSNSRILSRWVISLCLQFLIELSFESNFVSYRDLELKIEQFRVFDQNFVDCCAIDVDPLLLILNSRVWVAECFDLWRILVCGRK